MEFKYLESLGRDLRDAILRALREYTEALTLAIVMAIVLRTFVFAAYKISNMSMEPGMKLGDFVIGYKLPYGVHIPFTNIRLGHSTPRRGDILVFRCPKEKDLSCVKRVVGLEGDRIEIKGKRLILNQKPASYTKEDESLEPYFRSAAQLVVLRERSVGGAHKILISDDRQDSNFGPYIVPPRHVFMLGDNRDFSEDSRHWGAVPIEAIESRLVWVWFSIEWSHLPDGDYSSRVRWDRIFSAPH